MKGQDSSSPAGDINTFPRAVVAMAGARDHYQLPLALNEENLLQALVTDVYWPTDAAWFAQTAGRLLPEAVVAARHCNGVPSKRVRLSARALCLTASMKLAPRLRLNHWNDRALGRKARRLALQSEAALFSYNYYAAEAFKGEGRHIKHRLLFQLQADVRTSRRILSEEIDRVPAAKTSLMKEYELSLSEAEVDEACNEPHLANGWLATTTFAAQSLADHGIPSDDIHVVPYGVDSEVFMKRPHPPKPDSPFRVVYVGKLRARKGLLYLLEALRLLKPRNSLRLTLCTREQAGSELLKSYSDLDVDTQVGLSGKRLAAELHACDIFVFPSLAEGFGHVILEAMSCGLPVVATPHTCAPDVIEHGGHGFIVPIRDAGAIAERIAWGIDNRAELAAMGEAAAVRARQFTWERFRAGVRDAYRQMVAAQTAASEAAPLRA